MFNPPWAADLSQKPLPSSSTNAIPGMDGRRPSDAQQGAADRYTSNSTSTSAAPRSAGPYHYYQAPARSSSDAPRRSYSERAGEADAADVLHGDSPNGTPHDIWNGHEPLSAQLVRGGTTSDELARNEHVNSTALPGSSHQDPIQFDLDDVPDNLRAKPWSPEPPVQHAPDEIPSVTKPDANVAITRHESVSHRSPLQKLEGHLEIISKEEKRARLEDAESNARKRSLSGQGRPTSSGGELQRGGTLRSEKGRVVSDGSKRPSESSSDRYYQDLPKEVTTGSSPGNRRDATTPRRAQTLPNSGGRSRDAELDRQRSARQQQEHPITSDPRPYHHAPSTLRDPGVRRDPRPYHHAPAVPRDLGIARQPESMSTEQPMTARNVQRSSSEAQRRPEGGLGAVAAGATAAGFGVSAAERGRAAHERRKSREQSSMAGVAPITRSSAVIERNTSVRSQRHGMIFDSSDQIQFDGAKEPQRYSFEQDQQQPEPTHQDNIASGLQQQQQNQPALPSSARAKPATNDFALAGATSAATMAGSAVPTNKNKKELRFRGLFHREDGSQSLPNTQPQLEEWRHAKTARLILSDLEFNRDAIPSVIAPQPAAKPSTPVQDDVEVEMEPDNDSPWWEKDKKTTSKGKASAAKPSAPAPKREVAPPTPATQSEQFDGVYEEKSTMFSPPLFLKCGPLLRFTGIHRGTRRAAGRSGTTERAIWRGTVMIVTDDAQSDLTTAPVLRIFAQPMDLLPPPLHESTKPWHESSPELADPVAGQVKVSRTGRPLYVRPLHDIQGGVDLSREENNRGLYSATKSPAAQRIELSSQPGQGSTSTSQPRSHHGRIRKKDGERARKFREVRAVRLHVERGFTFWRFNLEIELGSTQHRVAYRINHGPALGFWVPARSQSMNIMFHSCNGFSLSVDSNEFSGPDPLWRDVLNKHQVRPFHVMVGGGDQLYMDTVTRETQLFGEWIHQKNPEHKHNAPFTPGMHDELESFYLNRYAMWFSQGLFAMAGSQIPMVNIWDDHDIIDGYGSYPHRLMSSSVFVGLGAVAFKYYMLFQHQSLVAETDKEEPSWILGASPGPYITQLSRSIFVDMGPHVKFLGIDCRTERTRDEIVSQETYELIFDRCEKEILHGDTKHLIVLLGVPIAYPRLNFLENILTSRVMDPIKAIGRTGMLGGFVNKFDGGVEILDDLDDHWTAKHHKGERNWFIQELQEFAAEKSVRITILGGDVHLGAVGQFYTPRKFAVSKDKDHRYMPNVISSAIVNTPPPTVMADILNRRNKVHHLDTETDEDLIPMFDLDVDGTRRNNKHLLPRRNYCTIREFMPGTTPPATPRHESPTPVPGTPGSQASGQARPQDGGLWAARMQEERDRRFPPGSMARTMSLTRAGAANLVRRLSGSAKGRTLRKLGPGNRSFDGPVRSQSISGPMPLASNERSFPTSAPPERPVFAFHRQPTNFSIKEIRRAAAKGGAPPDETEGEQPELPPIGHVNLEGGLDISLNMEINQHDAGGHTQSYRLLVPALFYVGAPDVNTTRLKTRRASFMQRLTSVRRRKEIEDEKDLRKNTLSPPPQHLQNYQGVLQAQAHQASSLAARAAQPAASQPRTDGANEGYAPPPSSSTAQTKRLDANSRPNNTSGAYDKGYNLAGPPIGAGHEIEPIEPSQVNHAYSSRGVQVLGRGTGRGAAAVDRADQNLNNPYPSRSMQTQRQSAAHNPKSAEPDDRTEGTTTPLSNVSAALDGENGEEDELDDEEQEEEDGEEEEGEQSPPRKRLSKIERFYGVGASGNNNNEHSNAAVPVNGRAGNAAAATADVAQTRKKLFSFGRR